MITNPDEIRTNNRRTELARIRKTKEYRDEVKRLTKGKSCIWCGTTEKLTIHHVSRTDYKDKGTYIATLSRGWVMCNRCHIYGLHKGRILCPVCKTHYTVNTDKCWYCLSDEEKDEIKAKQRFWKALKKKWQRDQYRKFKTRFSILKGKGEFKRDE